MAAATRLKPRFVFGKLPLTVIVLIILNVIPEVIFFGADRGFWGSPDLRSVAYRIGAFWQPILLGAEPLFPAQPVTMFGSYALLHGGPVHMIVNMIALASLGTVIVERVGQKRFVIIYAITALGGSVGFGLLSKSNAPMVGASGALFGLLGVWVCWDYLDRRYYGDPLWVTLRAVAFLFLYNLVFWVLLSGNLAWETHFGGFVVGWLLAIYWGRSVLEQSRRRRFGTEQGMADGIATEQPPTRGA